MSLALLLAVAGGPPGRAADPAVGAPDWERKLDPFLRRMALGSARVQGGVRYLLRPHSPEVLRTLPSFVRADRAAPEPVLFVKARIDPGALESDAQRGPLARALESLGIEVRGRLGEVASLRVPAASLEGLAALPEVRSLKAARTFRLMNDVSTGVGQLDSRDANTAFGARGAGVIFALVDTGIDFTKDDFRKPDGTTRVLGIWDQTITDLSHGPPTGFTFGAFYSKADIDNALATSTSLLTADGHGHGSHVTGSAVGNGRQTGNGVPAGTFAGVAPDADILVVRVFDQNGIFCLACDLTGAVQFIQQFAAAAGKPWVGNMSLGDNLGAHDGTDHDEMTIDAVTGPGHPGAAMAIAAGNSAGVRFHWQDSFASAATLVNSFTMPAAKAGSDNDSVYLDIWYQGEDNATVQVQTPTGIIVSANRGVDTDFVCTADGAIKVDASVAPDPDNGDNEVFIQIGDSSICSPVTEPRTGTWTLRLVAQSLGPAGGGQVDLYNEATISSAGFLPLNTFTLAGSVSIPGTSKNALTAGSHISKVSWLNSAGGTSTQPGTVGALSSFSGVGPTRDGRIKPDIAAPGEWIGSTLAGAIGATRGTFFTERDGVHGDIRGTSMATPHVAGTAVLLLSLNPTLDAGQIRALIAGTAMADAFTGALPNMSWGNGKLNAYRAALEGPPSSFISADGNSTGFFIGAIPGAATYNIYRGNLAQLNGTKYGTCFLSGVPAPASGIPSPVFSDLQPPSAGSGFFYLDTGVIGGVEGSLGLKSDGTERPNTAPCL